MKLLQGQPVSEDKIPVLWLCGPPGVGKSTVGWAIYSQLIQSGLQTAYVDIDQLELVIPAPGRWILGGIG